MKKSYPVLKVVFYVAVVLFVFYFVLETLYVIGQKNGDMTMLVVVLMLFCAAQVGYSISKSVNGGEALPLMSRVKEGERVAILSVTPMLVDPKVTTLYVFVALPDRTKRLCRLDSCAWATTPEKGAMFFRAGDTMHEVRPTFDFVPSRAAR
ncbi:MAG TPA: hypothetical protein VFT82_01110 [Candidatus Paceibacterota bacterium]|nr:hypothetical protein [Candidatus Paceibacterota bacterium]